MYRDDAYTRGKRIRMGIYTHIYICIYMCIYMNINIPVLDCVVKKCSGLTCRCAFLMTMSGLIYAELSAKTVSPAVIACSPPQRGDPESKLEKQSH
jgi:hypothetical protein